MRSRWRHVNSLGTMRTRFSWDGKSSLLVLAGLLTFALGCGLLAESGARLRGEIEVTGHSDPQCILNVHEVSSKTIVGSRKVGQKFEETFVVAPGEREYYVTITCAGVGGRFKSSVLRLGSAAAYREGRDLGRIRIESI